MYGNSPEAVRWDDAQPDETALVGGADGNCRTGQDRTPRWRPIGFIEWFAVGLTLLPALLFLPGSQAFRLPIRTGAYAISLVAFVCGGSIAAAGNAASIQPSDGLSLMFLWLVLMILHPLTSPLLVGVAQFSCISPSSARCSGRRSTSSTGASSCARSWSCWSATASTPSSASCRCTTPIAGCRGSCRRLPGPRRRRPAGRPPTSGPTAAASSGRLACSIRQARCAGAGTVAALLGLVFCLEPLAWWKRGVALAFALAGISAIYLSHVRAAFVMTLGMMAVYLAMLSVQEPEEAHRSGSRARRRLGRRRSVRWRRSSAASRWRSAS